MDKVLKPKYLLHTPHTMLLSDYIMILSSLFNLTLPWLFHV